MRVAYIFSTTNAHRILNTMIIPQLENDEHGADVIGMFFFFDNAYFLHRETEIGQRLQALQEKTGMLLMACDQCAIERGVDQALIEGGHIGCFPVLYKAIEGAGGVDQVITL